MQLKCWQLLPFFLYIGWQHSTQLANAMVVDVAFIWIKLKPWPVRKLQIATKPVQKLSWTEYTLHPENSTIHIIFWTGQFYMRPVHCWPLWSHNIFSLFFLFTSRVARTVKFGVYNYFTLTKRFVTEKKVQRNIYLK